MLSIGPASSCDICYERYGQDPKAPWSIECGHIFCGECIQNIDDPRLCPMCRSPFEREACIKLHVDLDLALGEPSSVDTADLKEARRIQHAIASIPETGATEPSLRQLIQEGNNFLNSQPRNAYKDLRNAHRMISYLYEVKMAHRAQAQTIESIKKQTNLLTQEKEELQMSHRELQQKLEKQEEIRQYESETAAAVENTLREHCAQAKQAQKAASEQLKKLTEENDELKRQLKTRMENQSSKSKYGQQDSYSTFKPIAFDKLDLKDIAIQDPSSFLISPLPPFTNPLPKVFDSYASLPELASDADETHDSTDEESDEEVHTPDSSQQQLRPRPSEAREVRSQFAPESFHPPRPQRAPLEPSGLSRTAPSREHRRERSCSNPIPSPSASRSQSPFDSIGSSTAPLPPVQTTSYSTPSRDAYASPPSHDRNVLRSRLQDILTDNSTSSSLPTLSSSHFPPSLTRDSSAAQKDDRPQAGSSRSSEGLVTAQATGSSSKTPRSTSPNHLVGTRMSSASAEAKKLEDERRRRYREEKYGPDHDRQPNEPDRERERDSRRYTVSNPITGTSSASQAARREQQQQQPYGNPLNTPPPMPALKRSSTTGANYMNSRGLPSASSILAGQDQGVPSGRVPYTIPGSKNSSKSALVNPMTYP